MQPNKDNSRPNMPVMDIQRPVAPQSPQPTIIKPSSSLGRPATMEYTRPRPDNPVAQQLNPQSDMARVQQMAQEPVLDEPQKKRSKKPLVITLIILLVLSLAGGGAYYYFMIMNKNEPAPVVSQPEPAPEQSETGITATPEGVDRTIQSIDQGMNSLNDDQDYNPNDINDDALGL